MYQKEVRNGYFLKVTHFVTLMIFESFFLFEATQMFLAKLEIKCDGMSHLLTVCGVAVEAFCEAPFCTKFANGPIVPHAHAR